MTAPLYVAYKAETPSSLTDDAKFLVRYFCQECGFRPLPWMLRKFTELLEKGYDVAGLKSVIEATSMAPRPSWAYLSAIIRNTEQMFDDFNKKYPPSNPSQYEKNHQQQE